MGCRIIINDKAKSPDGFNYEIFFCSTSMWAFGPVMRKGEAEKFYDWLEKDPRAYKDSQLRELFSKFRKEIFNGEEG